MNFNTWLFQTLLSDKPSQYFEEVKTSKFLKENLPELVALIDVPQNPKWHPEGDVWTHTMMVIDQASILKNDASNPLYFMMAALMHDYGKATTTKEDEKGILRSIGHEFQLDLIETGLSRISENKELHAYVLNMVKLHMRPNALVHMNSSSKAFKKMFTQAINPYDLLLLAKADHKGRLNVSDYVPLETKLQEEFENFLKMNA